MSLDDEYVALLDDWAEEHRNNNRTRLVQDLTDLAEEATEATGEDDPRAAIEALLDGYEGYARDAGYDPDERHELDADRLEEMCLRDPVPAINPRHVIPPEMPSETWVKAGVVAGMLRYESDDSPDNVGDEDVEELVTRYCGGRSSVSTGDVMYRFDESIPALARVEETPETWLETVKDYYSDEGHFTDDDIELEKDFVAGMLYSDGEPIAEEMLEAMKSDGHELVDEVGEMIERLRQTDTELEMKMKAGEGESDAAGANVEPADE